MEIVTTIYQLIWLQPTYNLFVWAYTHLVNQHPGLMAVAIGLLAAGPAIPLMVRGFHDQRRMMQLDQDIAHFKQTLSEEEAQQKILQLLKKKQITFQSESLLLAYIALIMVASYPVLTHIWPELNLDLIYSFVIPPSELTSLFGPLDITRSSPTLSLLPAILLFVELRQSYRQQHFLTSFIDRWYAIILPLFVYFLIFWLPSGIAIIMSAMLGVSLYVRLLLNTFAAKRQHSPATS